MVIIEHVLLIAWWWGNLEWTSSALRFQSVWGLHACGQQSYLLPPGGAFGLAKTAQGHCKRMTSSPWRGTKKALDFVQGLNYYCFVLTVFFASTFSLTSWLNIFFETGGRPGGLKSFPQTRQAEVGGPQCPAGLQLSRASHLEAHSASCSCQGMQDFQLQGLGFVLPASWGIPSVERMPSKWFHQGAVF